MLFGHTLELAGLRESFRPAGWRAGSLERGTALNIRYWQLLFTSLIALSALAGCGPRADGPDQPTVDFSILSGSENQPLEPIIQEFAKREKFTVEVTYMGSVDIMRELASGASSSFDAVWPASSLWITLGDSDGVVTNSKSIFRSPVIFGVKKSVAQQLGWVGNEEIEVDDILAAAETGRLRFMMTNATQSDSGASAYLGFLYAFAGHPEVLSSSDLQNPTVHEKMKRILGLVDRTAGDSGFLKELFFTNYDAFDAMVNYESTIIETNQQLVQSGREPLYAVYPVDGIALADSPFAMIDKGNVSQEATFAKLQNYLLSEDVQNRLLALGRRAGPGLNHDPAAVDAKVFNPDWGIDTARILTPVKIPELSVMRESLNLYQSTLRKPSLTVYALDFSGSMASGGQDELKAAMRLLLDQDVASEYFLQASTEDVTIIVVFNDHIIAEWTVIGNDPDALLELAQSVDLTGATGGTDIYRPVMRGLELIAAHGTDGYFPAIVLMTDGISQDGRTFDELKVFVEQHSGVQVPVYAITFGAASEDQLKEIVELTSGAIFNGKTGLSNAFREVKGYN